MSRPNAYEIPSERLALFFSRKRHDLDFSRGETLPLCRRCNQPISCEQWAAMEACPEVKD